MPQMPQVFLAALFEIMTAPLKFVHVETHPVGL
jgi:hypothetical protein